MTMPPYRRWFQFELRSVFVVMTLLAIFVAMFIVPPFRQRAAVKAIQAAGGGVEYEQEWILRRDTPKGAAGVPPTSHQGWMERILGIDFVDHPHIISLNGTNCTDDACGQIAKLPKVRVVVLAGPNLTDSGLKKLGNLDLTSLFLESPEFTDEGLAVLERFKNLNTLGIKGTKITGTGFRHLAGASHLECLDLQGLPLNQDELRHIARLKTLEVLGLDGMPITDEGLEHLAGLTEMWRLGLRGTRVIGPGLRHLAAMSNLFELDLDQSEVASGLEHLIPLKDLHSLFLEETKVTDAALTPLCQQPFLTKLEILDLLATPVTKQQIEALRKALPNCKIQHSPFP